MMESFMLRDFGKYKKRQKLYTEKCYNFQRSDLNGIFLIYHPSFNKKMKKIVIQAITLASHKGPKNFSLTAKQLQYAQTDVLIKMLCFSVDPVMKFWAAGAPTYFSKVSQGDIFNCFGLGVVAQGNEDYAKGTYIFGNIGTATYSVLTEEKQRQCFEVPRQLVNKFGIQAFLYLINNGLAAYAGISIFEPEPGKTAVVSTAAGATGILVCSLLKKKKCKIIGLTSPSKIKSLSQNCDLAIDYTNKKQLKTALCENSFSYYFDNVGEQILDLIIENIEPFGKIALCGAISNYNSYEERGVFNLTAIIFKRLKLCGVAFLSQLPHLEEIFALFEGISLRIKEIGIHQFEEYFHEVLRPGNRIEGKVVVKFSESEMKSKL